MNSWTFNNKKDYYCTWINTTKSVSYNKWTYEKTGEPVSPSPTDEQIVEEILQHPDLEDKGFFEEMVAWTRRDAPKKLRGMLSNLYPWRTRLSKANADLSYVMLCKVVYMMGFRASETIEKRMILGPSNEWVRRYFEDFGSAIGN